MNNKVDLFLDSGAFSAWTQGKDINIHDYISFIKQYKHLIKVYANLDVIGIGGKQPNALTAEKTLENQKIMEKAGLSPLPCFHFGEPLSYLDYYVKKYDYLALGVAGNTGSTLIPWLNECFSKHICDSDGMPKLKVHGFAVTSLPIMIRYPWYSVDSTSWAITGGMGSIYVPRYKNGDWVYDENTWKIAVSDRSPSKKESGKHISTLVPAEQKIILNYIHSKGYKIGHSKYMKVKQSHELADNERWAEKQPKDKTEMRLLEVIMESGVSNRYEHRDELNIIYFHDLEKALPKWPWPFKLEKETPKFF